MLQKVNERFLLVSTRKKMELVKVLSLLTQFIRKCFLLKISHIKVTRKGIHWKLDLSEAIDFNIYLTGSYEAELANKMAQEINKDDVILDIGANVGAHTLPLGQMVGAEGKIYAIEPTDFAYTKLSKNIELNPNLQKRIVTFKSFLSDGVTKAPDKVSSSWSIRGSMKSNDRNQLDMGIAQTITDAQITTLDKLVLSENITRLDVIKIDVDGYEVDVLKGAKDTIEKFSPLIFIEFSPIHYEAMNSSFEEQVKLLVDYGYCFEDVFGKPVPSDIKSLMDYIPRGTLVNIVARKNNQSLTRKEANAKRLSELKETLNDYMKEQRNSWSFLKVMKPGYASKKLYAIYMVETYHYTFHNSRNQAIIATRNEDLDINYMKFCLDHAQEETGHELMALHDIQKLGYKVNKNNLPEALPATKELIRYIYDVAENSNPLARLGYSFWAERVYSYIRPLLGLMKVVGIGNKAMTFFNEHSDIDAKHAEDVDRAIIRFAKTEEDWKAIETCMIDSLDKTIKMTHEVLAEYDKILNSIDTRYDSLLGVK